MGDEVFLQAVGRRALRVQQLLLDLHALHLVVGVLQSLSQRGDAVVVDQGLGTLAAMAERGLPELSLYPEDRGCPAPTAARVLDIFAGLARHHLHDANGHLIQTFHPELTDLQRQVLDLLDIPTSVYTA